MNCLVHGVAKSWTWLRDFHFHFDCVRIFTSIIQRDYSKIVFASMGCGMCYYCDIWVECDLAHRSTEVSCFLWTHARIEKEHLKGERIGRASLLWSQKWTHTNVKMDWETCYSLERSVKSMSRFRKHTAKQNSMDWKVEKLSIGQRFRDAELKEIWQTTEMKKFCSLITWINKREAIKIPPLVCVTSVPNRLTSILRMFIFQTQVLNQA